MKNIFYFIIAVAVLLLVAGVVLYLKQSNPSAPPQKEQTSPESPVVQKEEAGLGGELYQNPGGTVPKTNPFGAQTNPFEGYKNPFEEQL